MNHLDQLSGLIAPTDRITVLTGAGLSAASGIPAYRDDDGNWMHSTPIQYADFVASEMTRRRYWARSFAGWRTVSQAAPNVGHRALAALERHGTVRGVISQNVDDLHRAAGSRRVIDLHGRLRRVTCLACAERTPRSALQARLEQLNPGWDPGGAFAAPDGDATVAVDAVAGFDVADCEACGGLLKPDVVFFGENVPRERVSACHSEIGAADALLVVGSSLTVYSGYRFARAAHHRGIPLVILNRGRTRADELADLKLETDLGALLAGWCERLTGERLK